jgi:hypothetical protein
VCRVHAQSHRGVEQARAVDVQDEAVLVAEGAGRGEEGQGQGAAVGLVVRGLDTHRARAGEVRVVRADGW